jgi:hypothetical protein
VSEYLLYAWTGIIGWEFGKWLTSICPRRRPRDPISEDPRGVHLAAPARLDTTDQAAAAAQHQTRHLRPRPPARLQTQEKPTALCRASRGIPMTDQPYRLERKGANWRVLHGSREVWASTEALQSMKIMQLLNSETRSARILREKENSNG